MTLQLGTPITYRNGNGELFAGFISGNGGIADDHIIYWDTTQSGAVSCFKGPILAPTRDDTLSANNTFAVLQLTAAAEITGA